MENLASEELEKDYVIQAHGLPTRIAEVVSLFATSARTPSGKWVSRYIDAPGPERVQYWPSIDKNKQQIATERALVKLARIITDTSEHRADRLTIVIKYDDHQTLGIPIV